jgi:hypothetical protein
LQFLVVRGAAGSSRLQSVPPRIDRQRNTETGLPSTETLTF